MKNPNKSNPDRDRLAPPPVVERCRCGVEITSKFARKRHREICPDA